MKINKELMKGSTSILILTLLKSEDMYGYQITQELERRSDSTFEMKEGPDKTEELDYFYPTSVLVTGYDIIPFWVMRMMFSAI